MFKRIAWLIVIIPLAVLVIAFAVANRAWVPVSFDPIGGNDPALTFKAPVFLLILASLLIGMVIGGGAAWFKQGKWRKAARSRGREAERWRAEANEVRRRVEDSSRPALAAPSGETPAERVG